MFYIYILQTQIIFDQNITTVQSSQNKYEYSVMLETRDRLFQYNNYSLLLAVNTVGVQVNISSCSHFQLLNIYDVLLLNQVQEEFKMKSCLNNNQLKVTFITTSAQTIKIHASLSVFFQQYTKERYSLYVMGNTTGILFTHYNQIYKIETDTLLQMRYYATQQEYQTKNFTNSNNIEIQSSNNNVIYIDFLSENLNMKIDIIIKYAYSDISVGSAMIVPVIQSNYYQTFLFSDITTHYSISTIFLKPFSQNIIYKMVSSQSLVYYTDNIRTFIEQNVSIITTYNKTEFNVIWDNLSDHQSYMFVTVQKNLCKLQLKEQKTGCDYYIFNMDDEIFINYENEKNRIYISKEYDDQQIFNATHSPIVQQQDILPRTPKNKARYLQINFTKRIIIQCSSQFYISFSMDNEMILNNFQTYVANKYLYYDIMPIDAYMNKIVQIKTSSYQDKISAILAQEIQMNIINEVTIIPNEDNYFFTDIIPTQMLNNYYALRVQKQKFRQIAIYIGYDYAIPQQGEYNKAYKYCSIDTCEIIFNMRQIKTKSIYINIQSFSEYISQGTVSIQIVPYSNNMIQLGGNLDLSLDNTAYYMVMDYQNIQYIIQNGNIYFPQYAYILTEYNDQYCLKEDNFFVQIQQIFQAFITQISCVDGISNVNVTISTQPVWLVQNLSQYIGPQYLKESIYFYISIQTDRNLFLYTNNTANFKYYQSNYPCHKEGQHDCVLLVWNKYNITKIDNYKFVNVMPGQLSHMIKYSIEIIQSFQLKDRIPLTFDNMKGEYMHYQFEYVPLTGCLQYPSIHVSNLKSGCVVMSTDMTQLLNIKDCNQQMNDTIVVITNNTPVDNFQTFNSSYELYFKIITTYGQILIENFQFCNYGEIILIPDCALYNNLIFLIPKVRQNKVFIQTSQEIFYNIINLNTSQSVQVVDTFYQDQFLTNKYYYQIKFQCIQTMNTKQNIQFYMSNSNLQEISNKIDLIQAQPNINYMVQIQYNTIFLQADIQNSINIQVSKNGLEYITLTMKKSLIITATERIYFKVSSPQIMKIIQISNLYPQLIQAKVEINYATKQIIFPFLNDYLVQGFHKENISVPIYQFFVNYQIYYNGTSNNVEISSQIFEQDHIFLLILIDNQTIYKIENATFINSDMNDYQRALQRNQLLLKIEKTAFISMFITLITFIFVIIMLYVKISMLNKSIIQEQTQILKRISIINKKNSESQK